MSVEHLTNFVINIVLYDDLFITLLFSLIFQ